jgi:pantoate kinase
VHFFFSWFLSFLYSLFTQTLTTLKLFNNKIGREGLKYLANLLRNNTVNIFLSPSLSFPSLIFLHRH